MEMPTQIPMPDRESELDSETDSDTTSDTNPEPGSLEGAGLVRVDEDSPDRCQSVGPRGQCMFRSVPGYNKCTIHGGAQHIRKSVRNASANYDLTKWKARIQRYAQNPQVKSLREEVGILRMQMETLLNKCETDADLLAFAPQMLDLVTRIEKTVVSCQALEQRNRILLDKSIVLQLADEWVTAIAAQIKDDAVIDSLVSSLLGISVRLGLVTDADSKALLDTQQLQPDSE